MTQRVGIFISGGGSNMEALVRSMQGEHPARPVFVISNDPGAGGLQKARDMGLPALAVDHRPFGRERAAFEAALSEAIAPHSADIICLAGFMRVLTPDFVESWRGRILNIHPSLLPKYRGLDTHARAIEAGDEEAGCTVHEVTPALDDGPILGQARVPIQSGDTPADLAARILPLEHRLYPAVLRRVVSGEKRPLYLT